jgi:hypothetical protein
VSPTWSTHARSQVDTIVNLKSPAYTAHSLSERLLTRSIFYYISGHGFGHATRSAEVINALKHLRPTVPVFIRSWASRNIFTQMCPERDFKYCQLDIGVVQEDGISMNISGTLQEVKNSGDRLKNFLSSEIKALREYNAGCIVSDIPAPAHRLAQSVAIPSLAVTNFSWDWIYEKWIQDYPEAGKIVDLMRHDYSMCDELLRLPYAGVLKAFSKTVDVPMLGRKARLPKDVVKKRLRLDGEKKPLVLLSFGGMGLNSKAFGDIRHLRDFRVLATFPTHINHVTHLEALETYGISYPDLVGAVDIVITKPGYGIVSECAVNHTRILYTDRGPFREYEAILNQLPYWNCGLYIPLKTLLEGHWKQYLEELMNMNPENVPGASEAARAAGASVAAESILKYYDKGRIAT